MDNIHSRKLIIPLWLLFAIILFEGFVTISVEILAIRQLAPFVGNSVIVTSLIIGVFLLFLALGYRRGGMYTSDYIIVLKRNFTAAAILTGIGLSYVFTLYFFTLLENFVTDYVLFNLSLYLLIILSPIVYILGQTIPITTNLFRQSQSVGAISGTALFVSTLGSFLGAVLTSLLLLSLFGVGWSVFINYALLFGLTMSLCRSFAEDILRAGLLASFLYLSFMLNVNIEKTNLLHTNAYANYQLNRDYVGVDGNKTVAFVVNHSVSSTLNPQKVASPYVERIKQFLFKDLALRNKDILVLGAGGFTLSAQATFDNRFTYVDIDKDIKQVAQDNFVSNINGKFIAADARLFLRQTKHKYDVIVTDAFSSRMSIPYQLLTRAYFNQLRSRLNPQGIAVFNIIAHPLLDDVYSKRIDNTITSVFPNCMKVPLVYVENMANILYFCRLSDTERDNMVYSDNLNSSTMDYFHSKKRD